MTDHDRVYFTYGRVAHLMRPSFMFQSHVTVCGLNAWYGGTFGTGCQEEYEKAARLPLCQRCELMTRPLGVMEETHARDA